MAAQKRGALCAFFINTNTNTDIDIDIDPR